MVIEGVCVSIAMYCIIQFYLQMKFDLAEHRPLLKVVAIKLVIFLSFWQTLLISFLTSSGAIKASSSIGTPDIKVGIPAMLLCIEMAIFSVFHLWAFPWQVYDIRRSHIVASESAPGFLPDPNTSYQGGPFGVRALGEAFNPWDIIKNIGRAFRWGWKGRKVRHQDISYKASSPNNGAGLEPTRNQFTAFTGGNEAGSAPYDGPDTNPYAGAAVTGGAHKTGHYTPLSDDEDEGHIPSQPRGPPGKGSPYPRPMERLPPQQYGVTSGGGVNNALNPAAGAPPASHLAPPYPMSPTEQKRTASGGSVESQDTSYHGRSSSLTPDPHPLGPPGRKSHEQEEWEQYDGAGAQRGENERDLGGGHGVRDNRF